MPNRIKIFAEGEHKTKSAKKSWSFLDLVDIVKNTLESGVEKIPFTIHHPRNDLPILGYADPKTLKIEREATGRHVLTIEEREFAEPFKDVLKKVGLNKVSVALTANKVLKHIGLVDAPAVEGLGVAFAADSETADEFFFEQNETKMEGELEQLKKELNDLRKQSEAIVAAREEAERKAREAEQKAAEVAFEAELDKFFGEMRDRLTPKQEAILRRVAKAVRGLEGYEFSQDDGKAVKTTALDELKAFVRAMPAQFSGEKATATNAASQDEPKTAYERAKRKLERQFQS